MSVVFSIIVILLLTNKDFSFLFVVKEKQHKSISKLYIDFTVCLTTFLVVGVIIQYPIFTFVLEPLKLEILLLVTMIAVSIGLSVLADYLLKKFDKATLVVFNKYHLAILTFIGFVLTMQISGTVLASLILTLFTLLGFFVVGIIIITMSEIITPKIKLIDNTTIILILGSILLMLTSIL